MRESLKLTVQTLVLQLHRKFPGQPCVQAGTQKWCVYFFFTVPGPGFRRDGTEGGCASTL
jgi:hypothetical protein